MRTRAAVFRAPHAPIEIEELELTAPREGEVLVKYLASGMCHTDVHLLAGDIPARTPLVLGHEGAGEVLEVGPGVSRVKPGDHFVCSFIPACGTCRWCASGMQSICDTGADVMVGHLFDGRYPMTGQHGEYGALSFIGTFSQYGVVPQSSLIPIDKDLPLDKATLVGCGVPTGWGSVVNTAGVKPGQTVVIYGIGGIGINAVQGARLAGARNIVAVDPVPFKREMAMQLGATHTLESNDAAHELIIELTRGVGADAAILCASLTTTELADAGFSVIRKGGIMVVVGINRMESQTIHVSAGIIPLFRKTVKGSLCGDCNPTADIPMLLELYRAGDLKLDELVTRTYRLDEVNQGFADMERGINIRGVILHDH